MAGFTVDTQILMFGSACSDKPERVGPALQLMEQMANDEGTCLVLDDEELILEEYHRKLPPASFGRQWLANLFRSSDSKIEQVRRKHLDRGTQTALQEAHFDNADVKFVRASAASRDRVLVAEESDYSRKVCKILRKRLRVGVVQCEQASDAIDAASKD
jgi:hypothetical protein